MQRLSRRLREVVLYKNWTQEASSEKRPRHIYFIEDHLLHAISKSRHVHFHIVTKVLRIFKVAPHSEQKDQRMRQEVAYKKLKKLENH